MGSLSAVATGFFKAAGTTLRMATVVQDHDNNYNRSKGWGAGLGVYHKANDNGDDNVTTGELLKLKFSRVVELTGLSMRNIIHRGNFASGATFQLNGVNTLLSSNTTGLKLIGAEFSFAFGGAKGDQFYLGNMTVSDIPKTPPPKPTPPNEVPEPATYALMLGGLALVGLARRRRRSAV